MKIGPYPAAGAGVASVTLIVAASNSLDPTRADYQCDGVNDHLEIQAAIDALPATGGEVRLLDGTYNIEVSLVLDSYQTLRGCGRSTILTTTTANLDIITATGGSSTEKVGITIADLCIDGGAGGATNDNGILWTYVDDSSIHNVWCLNNKDDNGIGLTYCDHNRIEDNTCRDNENGIWIDHSNNNTITGNVCPSNMHGIFLHHYNYYNTVIGNTCPDNSQHGIYLDGSYDNTITGNTCQGNNRYGIYIAAGSSNNTVTANVCQENVYYGIYVNGSHLNTIVGNTVQRNGRHGIYVIDSNDNTIVGNTLTENSQELTNTYDDIMLGNSDYNNIQCNTCRAGALAKVPKYGINISHAICDGNLVTNNDMHDDGFGTGSFNDAGTATVTVAGNRT